MASDPYNDGPLDGDARKTVLKSARESLSKRAEYPEHRILFAMICLALSGDERPFTKHTIVDQLLRLQRRADPKASIDFVALNRALINVDSDEWRVVHKFTQLQETIRKTLAMIAEESTLRSRISDVVNPLFEEANSGLVKYNLRVTAKLHYIDDYPEGLEEREKTGLKYRFDLRYGTLTKSTKTNLRVEPFAQQVVSKDPSYNTSERLSSLMPVKSFSQPTAPSQGTRDYLQRLIDRCKECPWLNPPLALNLRAQVIDKDEPILVREWLKEWAESNRPNRCFLIGDWGSGKTGLSRWFAGYLAQEHKIDPQRLPVPLILNMRLARHFELTSIQNIARLTPAVNEVTEMLTTNSLNRFLVVLDGLDELIDPSNRSHVLLFDIIAAICHLMPRHTLYLVTCREAIYNTVASALCAVFDNQDYHSEDRSKQLLEAVRGQPSSSRDAVLRMCSLELKEADEYFKGTPWHEVWLKNRDDLVYQDFARRPLTLELLTEGFHRSGTAAPTTLADLYECSLSIRFREEYEKRMDKLKAEEAANELLDSLERRVTEGLHQRKGPQERKEFLQTQGDLSQQIPLGSERDVLIQSGLVREFGATLLFTHYTYVEYFITRCLCREFRNYDARTLQRLNLVGAYCINRLLVPLLKRELDELHKGDEVQDITLPVNVKWYKRFLADSKWRQDRFYGTRPNRLAYYGESSAFTPNLAKAFSNEAESPPMLDEGDANPITDVSCYDAFQFCRWFSHRTGSRCRLSSEIDLRNAYSSICKWPSFAWSGDWSDETKGHMVVVGAFGRRKLLIGGVNPDYRPPGIGFCITYNSKHTLD